MNSKQSWIGSGLCIVILLAGFSISACSRSDATGLDPNSIESKYGVTGAHTENVMTPDGPIGATVVPITMGNGQKAELVIPQKTSAEDHPAYIRDDQGLHPIALNNPRISRAEMVQSGPAVVERRPEAQQHKKKRSWEREALIIGGGAGAGAAIGAAAGGGKGAGVGALSGGVGGLIYDLVTRNK